MRRWALTVALGLICAWFAFPSAQAADMLHVTLGLQQTGTALWEITAMKALGIDRKHGLDLTIRPLADNPAGQVALQSGAVDIILSDFVWVSLQRDRGNKVAFVPHSLAVGGVMVDAAGGVKTLADLKGQMIAAAGTPVDKSWVVLQADYGKLTGRSLADDATVRFGAPPLVNELLANGHAQAALNYWNWNARARTEGKVELISVQKMLSDLGVSETPPLLGWVFRDQFAATRPDALKAFLDASFETKQALLDDDAVWTRLRGVMGVGDNDKLFTALRDGYREGIITSYDPARSNAAAQTFALLVKYGGQEVVGDATALAPGTFYKGYRK